MLVMKLKLVTNAWSSKLGAIERSIKSLETKFNIIESEIAKFIACVMAIRNLVESGTSELDIIEKALKIYQSQYGNKKNSFMHYWAVVKNLPWFFEPSRLDTSKGLKKVHLLDMMSSLPVLSSYLHLLNKFLWVS